MLGLHSFWLRAKLWLVEQAIMWFGCQAIVKSASGIVQRSAQWNMANLDTVAQQGLLLQLSKYNIFPLSISNSTRHALRIGYVHTCQVKMLCESGFGLVHIYATGFLRIQWFINECFAAHVRFQWADFGAGLFHVLSEVMRRERGWERRGGGWVTLTNTQTDI